MTRSRPWPQYKAEFHEDAVAGAEIAADVIGEHAQPVRGDAQNARKLVLLAHRAAAAGIERIAAGGGVVRGERRARFKRNTGDAIDVKVHRHHMVGRREGRIGCGFVAEGGVDRDVLRRLVPHERCAELHRVFRMKHERQFLVVDRNRFGGIERLRLRFGDHSGDRLAHMAHLVGWQQRVRADEHGAAAGSMELHVVFGFRQRIVRNRLELIGEAIGAAIGREHARHGVRFRKIHATDARMRVGRTHHR